MKRCLLGLMLALSVASPALATDLNPPASLPDPYFVDEVRLGGFVHSPFSPEKNGGLDLNAEILFAKPWGSNDQWWLPRPHLGTTVNFEGKTSTIYAGLTWQYHLTQRVFGEASFGGSLNNGQLQDFHNARNALGCHGLFRVSGSLGYDLTEHWSIMATVEHNSNANLCDNNRGITNYGLRIGYRF